MLRSLLLAVVILLAVTATRSEAVRSTSRLLIVPQSGESGPVAPVIVLSSPQVTRGVKVVTREAKLTVTGRATHPKGIATVTVNGVAARLNDKGDFSADILLKPGSNDIVVVAVDTAGNEGFEKFTMSRQGDEVAPAVAALAGDAANGKRYALVIGINAYRQIPQLRTAAGDAKEVAKVLEEEYGFQTTVLLDEKATRAAIIKELNALKNRVNPGDSLLVYYAGHGFLDKETETSYWLPVDADKGDPSNWLEAKTVTDQLKRAPARQVLVVADSCYSGTISRAFEPSLAAEGGNREGYLKRLTSRRSRILIASGGNEPVSDSGGTGHSIFADIFLKALRNPFERRFTAEELMTRHLKEAVAGQSAQTPEYKVIRDSGHDSGDFVFSKLR
ncbi:caspase family protein [Geomonas sp. Red32]|uniref:caspase family protein n=1 Tax=Geomonas sp. Red32 TaxID=2912856 RepID=UPI00202CBF53|nr:caspase family protein [Geomonas sp. Red32]MCM0080518.1 caspase family protein [Geomonas sp. Red32]